ncbi:MAG: hypothetical protein ABI432_02010 [Flavobacteriales bacterium]
MSGMIGHALLDRYEQVAGELERLPAAQRPDAALWELVDELLLDLHLIRHGYTSDGYEKHVARRLEHDCADESVVERMHAIRL